MRIWLDLICTPLLPRAPKRGARMKRLTLLPLCALLVGYAVAADSMTHEETVVRTAYAKLAFAVEQSTMSELAMESLGIPKKGGPSSDQRMAAAQLSFTLSDFKVGNASEILNRKVEDLIMPAYEETIQVAGGHYSYIEDGKESQWYKPDARWQPTRTLPPDVAEVTLADFYQLQWHQKRPDSAWQRYASYSVVVTYQGKSRGPYKALFLFGHDANGNEVVEPEDGTVDAGALAEVMHEHLFPDAFLHTRLRLLPVVANWLKATQSVASTCSVEQGVCCDLERLQCGPAEADVAKALLPATPGPKEGK
jgi:hypothetical protein